MTTLTLKFLIRRSVRLWLRTLHQKSTMVLIQNHRVFSILVDIYTAIWYNLFDKLEFDEGSEYMSKGTETEKRIIAMAYFHRYGWIAAMMVCIAIWPKQMFLIFSVACLSFSVWSFIGYKKKWKHIYCSFQNSYHQKMTPNNIQWHKVKKSDAYGVPLIFLIIGLALLVIMILY